MDVPRETLPDLETLAETLRTRGVDVIATTEFVVADDLRTMEGMARHGVPSRE
jgi:hypothetical protein